MPRVDFAGGGQRPAPKAAAAAGGGGVASLGIPEKAREHLSNEKSPGWLFGIGDYTTHLYGDFNKPS